MKLIATLFDNRYNKAYNITEAISDIEITTKIFDDAGKCTFKIQKINDIAFWEGATVSLVLDGYKIFKGYVFTKSRDKFVDTINVTCYDQLRYLKNKDFMAIENLTSDQVFSKICDKFALKFKVIDKSPLVLPPRNFPDISLYEMIKWCLDKTLIGSKEWFIVRDNFGILEHINVKSLRLNHVLGDMSGVTDFTYETSIDSDTYNQIKLFKENKKTKKRETIVVNDTINGGKNLKEWGILQLYQKVDENLNTAQMEQKALDMLKFYNSVKRTLKLTSIGIPQMTAGSIFKCKIKDLGDLSIYRDLLVTSCSHKITNNEHTMILDTEVM